jgi:hypothetical protein
MCMFCAAVPATLALAVAGQTKQNRARKATGKPSLGGLTLPVSALALGVSFVLSVLAAVYHLRWPAG